MEKQVTIIRVRRGINGVPYAACDASGNFIGNFSKLSEVRRHWQREIRWGQIKLIRELNSQADMSKIEAAKKAIDSILKTYIEAEKEPTGGRR